MKKILLLFLVLLSIVISCKTDRLTLDDLSNVKSKVEEDQINGFKKALKVQLGENIDASGYMRDYKILWNMYLKKSFADGKIYYQVPIQNTKKEDRSFYYNDLKKSIKVPDLQIIYYKDSTGREILRLMEMIPDGNYANKHGEFTEDFSYSGLQLFRKLDGKLLNGYRFKDGNRISKVFPGLSSGRINGEICVITYRQFYSASCYNYYGVGVIVKGTNMTYTNQTGPMSPGCPYEPGYNCSCYEPIGSPEVISEVCTYIPDGPTNPGTGTGLLALKELKINKSGLYGPCPGLTDAWRNLIDWKAGPVQNKLSQLTQHSPFTNSIPNLGQTDPNWWYTQGIRDGEGITINLDEFSVFMDDLPIVDGKRLSIGEFEEYIRKNINQFVDNQYSSFSPHPMTGYNEYAIWNSNNPLGAVISINIPIGGGAQDNGSVIVSEKYNSNESAGWTFTTIHDPWNGDHPVSGNRAFGVYETADGYIVYTRGADRLTTWYGTLIEYASRAKNGEVFQFNKADNLWLSFQDKVQKFAINHGTNAQIRNPIRNRPKWGDVKNALDNNRSLSTVPCN